MISGLGLLESRSWNNGRLWVSDWTAGLIRGIDPTGAVDVTLEHRYLPICFDFLPGLPELPKGQGLVLTSGTVLLRLSADGALIRYADLSVLSPCGCNDIVIGGRKKCRGHALSTTSSSTPRRGGPPVTGHPGLWLWPRRMDASGWSPTIWRFPTGGRSPPATPR